MATAVPSDLFADASCGRLTRREVLRRGAVLGLSAPAIAALLAACGGSSSPATSTSAAATTAAATAPAAAATSRPAGSPAAASPQAAAAIGKRGDSGELKLLWWQAPVILNPHIGGGQKDTDASTPVLEPLASFDKDANLVPILASEIPSLQNGQVAKDGLSVTWKLKQGVTWSDGQPFSANDVKFTYDFVMNPKTAAASIGNYTDIASVDVLDDSTVRLTFKQPKPDWFTPFTNGGMILPQHILKDFVGENARNAPFNLKPTGTGPYKVDDFKPGDVISYSINDRFRDPNRPHFATITLKGGGDATSAARAVLQSGEQDYAWNLQIDPNVLKSMEANGKGKIATNPTLYVERIEVNVSDPRQTVDDQQSHYGTPHPWQSDPQVRQAYALAIQRDVITQQLYGPTGEVATNVLVGPPLFASKNTSWKFDLAAAAKLLDGAGWTKGPDGIRQKNGVKMSILYQTTVNDVRQKNQEIVKQAFQQLGIATEIKSIDSAVYFSADVGNPDTSSHFYADLEMHASQPTSPFPLRYMQTWYGATDNIAQRENKWSGVNISRWHSDEYDALFDQAKTELDPNKQADLFIKMNDLVVNQAVAIPEVRRLLASAIANSVAGLDLSPYVSDLWQVADWRRTK